MFEQTADLGHSSEDCPLIRRYPATVPRTTRLEPVRVRRYIRVRRRHTVTTTEY